MSPFEIGMLAAFGVSWPISIWKLWKAKRSDGKSVGFALIVILGYLSGITHKVCYNFDLVILLYIFNTLMVAVDLALTLWYRRKK
ncbi:MAG: hypothetical protein LBT05_14440 [Planctomycetaceae bacterium]|jgi:hypothetical protein|nr:hypothetical protein [Planctomycetaceae bacterium]